MAEGTSRIDEVLAHGHVEVIRDMYNDLPHSFSAEEVKVASKSNVSSQNNKLHCVARFNLANYMRLSNEFKVSISNISTILFQIAGIVKIENIVWLVNANFMLLFLMFSESVTLGLSECIIFLPRYHR
jgi:hypothetical protein